MNRLITNESPQSLIDAYRNNVYFKAVVTRHEIAGSDYKTMLEDGVVVLATIASNAKELSLKYVRQYGPLDDA